MWWVRTRANGDAEARGVTLTRRALLGGGAIAATAAVVGGAVALTASGPIVPLGLPAFTPLQRATFEKLVGQSFRVDVEHSIRRVTLASVESLAIPHAPRHRSAGGAKTTGDQYQLFFEGPAAKKFEQGTYTFTARGLHELGLFVVPVGLTETQQRYQAIIVNV
jgi:hypothetical protein